MNQIYGYNSNGSVNITNPVSPFYAGTEEHQTNVVRNTDDFPMGVFISILVATVLFFGFFLSRNS